MKELYTLGNSTEKKLRNVRKQLNELFEKNEQEIKDRKEYKIKKTSNLSQP
jgi:hypothetical protein